MKKNNSKQKKVKKQNKNLTKPTEEKKEKKISILVPPWTENFIHF